MEIKSLVTIYTTKTNIKMKSLQKIVDFSLSLHIKIIQKIKFLL